jgi:hypothetical protein
VEYRNNPFATTPAERAYIPLEWFKVTPQQEEPPKAEMILLGVGTEYPHLTVYYNNGVFDHLRLYVRKESNHESWGVVPSSMNLDSYFEGITDLKLTF